MVEAYFRFILRFRWPILALMAIITGAAGWMITHGVIASTIGGMFLGDNPAYKSYLQRSVQFGNNDVLVIALEEPDLLSPPVQTRLATALDKVRSLENVRSVRSALDAQEIRSQDDTLLVNTYAQRVLDRPESLSTMQQALRSDRFAKDLLISEDGRHTSIVVELAVESDMPAEEGPILLHNIFDALEQSGFLQTELHTVGVPASIAAIVKETQFNLQKLFPIVCIALLITVWIMFRRLWPVAMTMTVALIAVIWTMGFSVLMDRHVTILASMVPAVILIISFSDVVHLCSAYLLELGQGMEKRRAILASGTDVGKACLLTSVTTFLGFVAMSFVPAPVFRHLGLVLGFGVAMALLIAVTLVPIMFSLLPRPKPWRIGATGQVQDLLDRFLAGMAALTEARPKIITAAFLLLFVLSGFGIFNLKIETDFAKRLSEHHPLRVDGRHFQEHFGGSNLMDVYLDTPEKDGLLDPERFEKIVAFRDAIEAFPEVTETYSLVDLMETLHQAYTGQTDNPMPQTRQALAQYLLLFEMAGGEQLDRLIDFNRQSMRMTVQMPAEGVRETFQTGVQVASLAPNILDNEVEIEVTGLMYLMGQWLGNIIAGQRRGLIFALVAIAIMMMVGLRSVRVGLWSMLPNVLPLAVLGGYLGMFWDQVDSDLLALAMIAIGIGVDDTIHFLMRFRIESGRQPDLPTAIKRTFHFSGRGIVITTIILVIGFSPFALSEYLSLNAMGTLLPLTLIVALLADLLFAPALVTLGAIRFSSNDKTPASK